MIASSKLERAEVSPSLSRPQIISIYDLFSIFSIWWSLVIIICFKFSIFSISYEWGNSGSLSIWALVMVSRSYFRPPFPKIDFEGWYSFLPLLFISPFLPASLPLSRSPPLSSSFFSFHNSLKEMYSPQVKYLLVLPSQLID